MLKLPVEGNKYTNYRKGGGEQLSWGRGGGGGSVEGGFQIDYSPK